MTRRTKRSCQTWDLWGMRIRNFMISFERPTNVSFWWSSRLHSPPSTRRKFRWRRTNWDAKLVTKGVYPGPKTCRSPSVKPSCKQMRQDTSTDLELCKVLYLRSNPSQLRLSSSSKHSLNASKRNFWPIKRQQVKKLSRVWPLRRKRQW